MSTPVPFTLECTICASLSTAEHIDSEAQALAEGWIGIHRVTDNEWSNFEGFCPEHRKEGEEFLRPPKKRQEPTLFGEIP